MGFRLIRIGKTSVANLPYIYKCRDCVVELCLLLWLGSMLLGEYLDWDKTPWYMYIIDFVIVDIAFYRFNRMLPRRCWRSVVYYSLYCAAAFVIGYTIVFFQNPDYFNTPNEWVKVLIIISIFLTIATFGAYMWYRRVKQCQTILLDRELRTRRRRKIC